MSSGVVVVLKLDTAHIYINISLLLKGHSSCTSRLSLALFFY